MAWKNSESLIQTDTPHLERSFEGQRIASTNYFGLFEEQTDPNKAQEYLQLSMKHAKLAHEVYPDDIIVEETLGLTQFISGDIEAARTQFEAVTRKFPQSTVGWDVLGQIHAREGNFVEAASFYRILMDRQPEHAEPYYRYTEAMVAGDQLDEAVRTHLDFTDRYPDLPYSFESIGYLLLEAGDTSRSGIYFFLSKDRGNPNMQYYPLLKDFYIRAGNLLAIETSGRS